MSNRRTVPGTVPVLGFPDVRTVPVYIYGLTDPRTGEVRYVGKSQKPEGRIASHRARSGARVVRAWCQELAAAGVAPSLVVLHTVPAGEDADPWERHFIAKHDGPRSLNTRGAAGSLSRAVGVRIRHERRRERLARGVVSPRAFELAAQRAERHARAVVAADTATPTEAA